MAGCGSKVNRKQSRNSISASTSSTQLMWPLIWPLPQRLFWRTIKRSENQNENGAHHAWFALNFCLYDGTRGDNPIIKSTTSTQLMWPLISPLPQRLFWSAINLVVKKWKVKIKQDHTMHTLHWFFCFYDGTKMKWKRIKVLTIKQVRSLYEQQHKDCCLFMSMENFNPILSRNCLNHQHKDKISQKKKITKIKVEKRVHSFQKCDIISKNNPEVEKIILSK